MSEMNKMSKEELFEVFCKMFPNWAKYACNYKKIGSRCLVITFNCLEGDQDGDPEGLFSRVFLYISSDNWQFGTKLWRKRSLNAVHNNLLDNKVRAEQLSNKVLGNLVKEMIKNKEENAKELLQENNGGDQNEE